MDIGPPELLIIVVVLLVLFGGSQIPKLAKNLGKAQSEFKKGLAEVRGEGAAEPAVEPEPAVASQPEAEANDAAAGEPAAEQPVVTDDSHDSTV